VTEAYVTENVALNFTGTFFTIQKAAPVMTQGGSIIVTTSFLNTIGYPGLSILAATKAAARSLVRTLGAELAAKTMAVVLAILRAGRRIPHFQWTFSS
jgi:NAD(P)-dependent dehydrogenase (short-subunit alcohol dehydrogenase family)